jgi:tetratricopeptide (TPR) repeat protein
MHAEPVNPLHSLSAETAYVFRHAILRDAAYQLQLPGDRGRLHGLALEVIEKLAGGRPPDPARRDSGDEDSFRPHATDPFAQELAEHARLAPSDAGTAGGGLSALRKTYLRRAAEHAGASYLNIEAQSLWQQVAGLATGPEKGESLRRAAAKARDAGRMAGAQQLLEDSLEIQREAGARRAEGAVLSDLATTYFLTGRLGPAEDTFRLALSIHREVGDPRSLGNSLIGLGNVQNQCGRMDQALQTFEQALGIFRDLGDRRIEGIRGPLRVHEKDLRRGRGGVAPGRPPVNAGAPAREAVSEISLVPNDPPARYGLTLRKLM